MAFAILQLLNNQCVKIYSTFMSTHFSETGSEPAQHGLYQLLLRKKKYLSI